MNNFFQYSAIVLRVVDGDTVDLEVDLGFEIRATRRVRLHGLNAPEVRTEEGRAVKAWLSDLLPPGCAVVLDSYKDRREKYGRYLGIILLDGRSVNLMLLDQGLAVPA